MTNREIDEVEALGFPSELDGHPLAGWMGDDWVQYVARELLAEFRKQDPGTEMPAIACAGEIESTERAG